MCAHSCHRVESHFHMQMRVYRCTFDFGGGRRATKWKSAINFNAFSASHVKIDLRSNHSHAHSTAHAHIARLIDSDWFSHMTICRTMYSTCSIVWSYSFNRMSHFLSLILISRCCAMAVCISKTKQQFLLAINISPSPLINPIECASGEHRSLKFNKNKINEWKLCWSKLAQFKAFVLFWYCYTSQLMLGGMHCIWVMSKRERRGAAGSVRVCDEARRAAWSG